LSEGRCFVCAQPVVRGEFFCPRCRMRLQFRRAGFCPLCGELYALEGEEPYLCSRCRKKRPPWSSFAFYSEYSGLLRDLLLKFKFGPDLSCAAPLGTLLFRAYKQRVPRVPDMILPVPLQKDRLGRRGFNQSLELALQLGRRIKIPVHKRVLEKQKLTTEQTSLPRKGRLKNLSGAFTARQEKIKGKSVLLVDDVATSGATFTACTRELLANGALRVDVICLARAS